MPRIVPYAQAQVGDLVCWRTQGGLWMHGAILADEGEEWMLSRNPYGGVCSLPKDPALALVTIDQYVERPHAQKEKT